MALVDLVDLITTNLGIQYPDLIAIAVIFSCLLFFALDIRIGAMMLFIFSGLAYIILEEWNIESYKLLITMAIALVIMALSFYISHKRGSGGLI